MKLYIIAGEASGDMHGANLVKALRHHEPQVQVRAWGGDKMQTAGADVRKHYRELAFMGFWEVLKNIRTIRRNFALVKSDIQDFQPDALVLIDYPGFNLRMAKWAKLQQIKVIYFISPQLWAWHSSRVHDIKKYVDKMLVILPFEKAFYARYNYAVEYVGHPLLDEIKSVEAEMNQDEKRTIALLPGSRKQEVSAILPLMLSVVDQFPMYQFVIAATPVIPASFYDEYLKNYPNVQVVVGDTYQLMQQSVAALVKSGTSTLETALHFLPQVVCYRGNKLSYHIAKRLVDIKYISLVNLILDRPLVKELIQDELTTTNITTELQKLLEPEHRKAILLGYEELRSQLGHSGASDRAAQSIIKAITSA